MLALSHLAGLLWWYGIGFFAPEMIIHGCYFGDKADVWSLGCILMELIMGHEKFCDVWMTAYDYDILQDKEQFTTTIAEAVEHLPDYLSFTSELNDFVMRFLELRSSRRPSVRTIAQHPWLEGFLAEELSAFMMARSLSGTANNGLAASPSNSFLLESEVSSKVGFVPRELIDAAYNNISDKERKQMEEYIQHHKNENAHDEVMHLPPITPATPSITKAKKILRKGNELANTNYGHIMNHLTNGATQGSESDKSLSEKSSNGSTGSGHHGNSMYDQYPYLSMTPETMSPAPSLKHQSFLSPGRSPLPSVAEAHEGSQDPYDSNQNNHANHVYNSPIPSKNLSSSDRLAAANGTAGVGGGGADFESGSKPSLIMSQSDGKIWQNSSGSSSINGSKSMDHDE